MSGASSLGAVRNITALDGRGGAEPHLPPSFGSFFGTQPEKTSRLRRKFGRIVTSSESGPAVARSGAPSSLKKCAQFQYGPGSWCMARTPRPESAGTLSWPRMWPRSSGMSYLSAR